jgi:hypothetical protein
MRRAQFVHELRLRNLPIVPSLLGPLVSSIPGDGCLLQQDLDKALEGYTALLRRNLTLLLERASTELELKQVECLLVEVQASTRGL